MRSVPSELLEKYEDFKAGISLPADLRRRLSGPLLMHVTEKWYKSQCRVLVVGQETLGWGFGPGSYYQWNYAPMLDLNEFMSSDDSVDAMVYAYEIFEFARYQSSNYRSPFWRAYRQIREQVGDDRDGIETSVLWTNLFKMCFDGGSVLYGGKEYASVILETGRSLLYSEIDLLHPTDMILFTGPRYDCFLEELFPGVEFCEIDGYDKRMLARIVHPLLPEHSLRTYHPGYLVRIGRWKIIEYITATLN